MKKVLVPISERDYLATDKRFFYLIKELSTRFTVESLTISKEVLEDIDKRLDKNSSITTKLMEPKILPLTLDFRTNLVKIFVQYTYKMTIPSTDLKLWKTAAFDDFWGHISTRSFSDLTTVDADIVLLPLMSYDDTPPEEMDVFYTSILFRAKESGAKVVGYQLYPVFQSHKLMPFLMDMIVVRKEYEKEFYVKNGIAPERIHLLTDMKDIYSISPIDDSYKNYMYNDQISIGSDELAVVIFNHHKYRAQIVEIINALGDARIPVVLSLVKRDFHIRDLHEDEIIKVFYFNAIEKSGCRFYLVEPQSSVPIMMISDVVVSPTYIAPIEFAARYEKKAYVYNPFNGSIPQTEGTVFLNRPEALSLAFQRALEAKRGTVRMIDILAM